VSLLVAIHAIDFVSFSLDLISFTTRNIHVLWYKIALDVISFSLALFIQAKFASSMTPELEREQYKLGHTAFSNFVKMRQWLFLEVALSYLAILSQLVFFTYVYCTINTNRFQEKYHTFRVARIQQLSQGGQS